jgi:hypothetical protein
MDRDAERVVAANEALSRCVNEGIERGQWPGEEDEPTAYRCECAQPDCNSLIKLTPRAYESVRSNPRHFVIAPGHERLDVETVIERDDGYLVIEKHGAAGTVADATDPRQ